MLLGHRPGLAMVYHLNWVNVKFGHYPGYRSGQVARGFLQELEKGKESVLMLTLVKAKSLIIEANRC